MNPVARVPWATSTEQKKLSPNSAVWKYVKQHYQNESHIAGKILPLSELLFSYSAMLLHSTHTHTHANHTQNHLSFAPVFLRCQPTVLLLHHSHHHQNNFWEMELYSIRHQTFQLELDWTRSRGAFEVVDVPVRNSRGLTLNEDFTL